jgi:hypothetical protein
VVDAAEVTAPVVAALVVVPLVVVAALVVEPLVVTPLVVTPLVVVPPVVEEEPPAPPAPSSVLDSAQARKRTKQMDAARVRRVINSSTRQGLLA